MKIKDELKHLKIRFNGKDSFLFEIEPFQYNKLKNSGFEWVFEEEKKEINKKNIEK